MPSVMKGNTISSRANTILQCCSLPLSVQFEIILFHPTDPNKKVRRHYILVALTVFPSGPPLSYFNFNCSFFFSSLSSISKRGSWQGFAHSTSSGVENERARTNSVGGGGRLSSFCPVPWRPERLPTKQLTFQTHFLNFIKPFISELLFGPCFTFPNTFSIIYHSFTFQLRTLAVCKSYPDRECERSDGGSSHPHFHHHLIFPNGTEKIVALDGVRPSNGTSLWSRHLHAALDMLMRLMLAGLRPGDLHPGESQIEIKLHPAPPGRCPWP